jgi:hypothetical protein
MTRADLVKRGQNAKSTGGHGLCSIIHEKSPVRVGSKQFLIAIIIVVMIVKRRSEAFVTDVMTMVQRFGHERAPFRTMIDPIDVRLRIAVDSMFCLCTPF